MLLLFQIITLSNVLECKNERRVILRIFVNNWCKKVVLWKCDAHFIFEQLLQTNMYFYTSIKNSCVRAFKVDVFGVFFVLSKGEYEYGSNFCNLSVDRFDKISLLASPQNCLWLNGHVWIKSYLSFRATFPWILRILLAIILSQLLFLFSVRFLKYKEPILFSLNLQVKRHIHVTQYNLASAISTPDLNNFINFYFEFMLCVCTFQRISNFHLNLAIIFVNFFE